MKLLLRKIISVTFNVVIPGKRPPGRRTNVNLSVFGGMVYVFLGNHSNNAVSSRDVLYLYLTTRCTYDGRTCNTTRPARRIVF